MIIGPKISLLVAAMLLFCFSSAQKKSKEGSSASGQKIDHILKSAEKAQKRDASAAYDNLEQALELSINEGDEFREAQSFYLLGGVSFSESQYYLAIQNYTRAMEIFKRLGETEWLHKSYMGLADAYKANKEYDQAITYYNLYIDVVSVTEDSAQKNQAPASVSSVQPIVLEKNEIKSDQILKARQEIADIYYIQNQLSRSKEIYDEVLKLQEAERDEKGAIKTMNRLGDVSLKQNAPEQALEMYSKSQKKAVEINDDKAVSESYKKVGNVYRLTKDFDNELNVRRQSLDHNVNIGNVKGQSEDNYEIGSVLVEKNEAVEAIVYLEQSIGLSEDTKNIEQKGKALKTLSEAYGKLGNYNKAYEIYREYAATIDTINKRKELELLDYLEKTTSLSKKQQQIDFLQKDAVIKEKKLEILKQERKIQWIVFYALVALIFILVMTAVFIYRNALLKKRAHQLLALRSLQSQMNPHFIFNALNSVNAFISTSDEKSANKFLTDFSKLMRLVMDNSKYNFISLENEINTLDLYMKLEHLRFQDQFDCDFVVEENLKKESIEIPPMIVQPFIENAIWHGLRYKSGKGHLKVVFKKQGTLLKVVIEDDGIGRTKSAALKTKHQKTNKSTAIKNIELRLQLIKALFKINIQIQTKDLFAEQDETGTHVELSVPMLIKEMDATKITG